MQVTRRSSRALATSLVALLALLALLALGAPARADWLVLRDGARLEIRGDLRVETRRVVFTLRDGTLSALPLAEVDLDATEAANRPPVEPKPPSPAPPRAPIARLTDADFDRGDDVVRPTILLFTASWSSWCDKAHEALAAADVRFVELDIEHDVEAARAYLELGLHGEVPVILFQGEIVLGFSQPAIDRIVAKWREAEEDAVASEDASRRPAGAVTAEAP